VAVIMAMVVIAVVVIMLVVIMAGMIMVVVIMPIMVVMVAHECLASFAARPWPIAAVLCWGLPTYRTRPDSA
jgi:hypothetical protein